MRILLPLMLLLALVGCSSNQAPEFKATDAPVGVWTGTVRSGNTLDIQPDGSIKVTREGKEMRGTWKEAEDGKFSVVIEGSTDPMTVERSAAGLKTTLPGDSEPSEFSLM